VRQQQQHCFGYAGGATTTGSGRMVVGTVLHACFVCLMLFLFSMVDGPVGRTRLALLL
jgi:hypothetical protein